MTNFRLFFLLIKTRKQCVDLILQFKKKRSSLNSFLLFYFHHRQQTVYQLLLNNSLFTYRSLDAFLFFKKELSF